MTTRIDEAITLLQNVAELDILKLARELTEDGTAVWREDPTFSNVVALVSKANRRSAYLVVYLDIQDFELDEGFENLLYND